ncbi:protoporphyrinogen oxidase [Paenibacillus albicereus]|uniref:Coproporphyrinogen III oxidase n=1 Tax=Paenibacillus albicereus TaxID=2726185 RepID=A0A6H2H4C6_9BACL|nr:protoporphyrinogen oxidase [Paenibacillus albicereus]QJC54276.1 protoporphyrinogen oxidase [Paenibacillus albicereus]
MRTGRTPVIAVAGAGLTGLSAAFYLQQQARWAGREARIVLLEASGRLGGRIETLRKDGFTIEKGPDSFLGRKTAILELTRELGLLDELVTTNPKAAKTYLYQGGRLHPMPARLALGVPGDMASFLQTELMDPQDKFRASLDFLTPPRPDDGRDESVGSLLERRFGRAMVERISEPLLAGIYAGDLYKLSLAATFPQFREAELGHGSLIRGMRAPKPGGAPSAPAYVPAAARGGVFMTYRRGLRTLVDGLDEALAGIERRMDTRIEAIRRSSNREALPYALQLAGGELLEADAVVVTVPSEAAAGLLEPLTDTSALRAVDYVSVANVVMAFREEDIADMAFDGSGFLVPRSEGRTITACTWTSSKWLHSSPDGRVLLRCYVGRAGAEEGALLPDRELIAAVRRDVRDTMGVEAEPLFTEITRLPRSMPQYPVGHVEAIAQLRAAMRRDCPGVYATGAAFDGVGLPDCIRQGREAARAIWETLD